MNNFNNLKQMPLWKVACILSADCNHCVVKKCKVHNRGSYWCKEEIMKWLKSEVKDND